VAWFHLSFENITPVTIIWNCNGGVMVSVLSSTAEEHEFDSWSGQTKHKRYVLLYRLARGVKEKEQRLAGWEPHRWCNCWRGRLGW
jgi:hypothetical protein